METNKKILIIGICGGLARLTARVIHKKNPDYQIIGVDNRDFQDMDDLDFVELHRIKYSRGSFEKLFRSHKFDTVYHLGRLSHISNNQIIIAKRLDLNLMGTSRILEMCLHNEVKKIVVLSTFHVYGALADNSVFLSEDAPLKASIHYPELRDVVEMDQLCSSWMWKHRDHISTIILRPSNIIGSTINNTMTQFLNSPVGLKVLDYNPIFQFIHEFDMANILSTCLTDIDQGIFNVCTDDYISLSEAQKVINKTNIPVAMSVGSTLNKLLKPFGLNIPEYLIDYLKYSCLIDNSNLKKQLGESFWRYNINETLQLLKLK